eukprot:11189918-Lingulodinium_polyedra.AAC.1
MVGACEVRFACGGGPVCKSMRWIQHRGVTASGQHDLSFVVDCYVCSRCCAALRIACARGGR